MLVNENHKTKPEKSESAFHYQLFPVKITDTANKVLKLIDCSFHLKNLKSIQKWDHSPFTLRYSLNQNDGIRTVFYKLYYSAIV